VNCQHYGILTKRRKDGNCKRKKAKIRKQVGNTERSKKRGWEMEEEPAEMERGKKARRQGQKTVASVRATEHKYKLRIARRHPRRYT
jgi:hypothetical protein